MTNDIKAGIKFCLLLLMFILIVNTIYAVIKLIIDLKNEVPVKIAFKNFMKNITNGIVEILSYLPL